MFYCSALGGCYCAYCSTAGIHAIINKVTVYFRACDLMFYAVYIVFEVLACAGNCCVSKTVLDYKKGGDAWLIIT